VKLVLATDNAGKLAELEALLAPFRVELVRQRELGISNAEETGPTFVENAILKARHASRLAGLPALADDSGLVVPSLGGEPGVRSARYSGRHGDDAANNRRLLERLITASDRRACFYCVLVLMRGASDPAPLVATGAWWGTVATAPSGRGGFGYDPIFVAAGTGRTAAELDIEEKNRISHRGKASARLVEMLGEWLAEAPAEVLAEVPAEMPR
jgi:XTP/dITP diphosphohydrolase